MAYMYEKQFISLANIIQMLFPQIALNLIFYMY